jgi:aquaglyceroporin related protein
MMKPTMVSVARMNLSSKTERVSPTFALLLSRNDFANHATTILDEDSEDSDVTLDGGRNPNKQPDPERFQTTINGRSVNMRRVPTSEANEVLHSHNEKPQSGEQGEDNNRQHAPVDEHGIDYSGQNGQHQHFGLQDGLPPLQELDKSKTTQTQKEEKEIEEREQQAEREFYDQYRNPIARFRAKYPQAPAEFLAVRTV